MGRVGYDRYDARWFGNDLLLLNVQNASGRFDVEEEAMEEEGRGEQIYSSSMRSERLRRSLQYLDEKMERAVLLDGGRKVFDEDVAGLLGTRVVLRKYLI